MNNKWVENLPNLILFINVHEMLFAQKLRSDAALLAYSMSGRQTRGFNLTPNAIASTSKNYYQLLRSYFNDQFNDSVQYLQAKQETTTYKKSWTDENWYKCGRCDVALEFVIGVNRAVRRLIPHFRMCVALDYLAEGTRNRDVPAHSIFVFRAYES